MDHTRIRCTALVDRIMEAEEAATLIPPGVNAGMSGFTGAGYPKAVPRALASRILCEVDAKLAAMVIQQWLIQLGCWQDPHRSLVKAAQVVRREAGRLMVGLSEGGLEAVVESIVRCMQSGCRLNTRKTFPNTSQFLLGTPLVWPKRKPATKVKVLT
jgi:acyl-CoA hydrolase